MFKDLFFCSLVFNESPAGNHLNYLDFFEAASGVCERDDPGLDRGVLGAMRFLNCQVKK